MEQGPVLIVTFNAHQVMYVTDLKGVVIEGSKDTIKNVQYIWALCRDQTILDPKSSWRLMESVANATDLFI
jgi:import inner membrane translocase subunit TIM44